MRDKRFPGIHHELLESLHNWGIMSRIRIREAFHLALLTSLCCRTDHRDPSPTLIQLTINL
jgi:hypothetical protein